MLLTTGFAFSGCKLPLRHCCAMHCLLLVMWNGFFFFCKWCSHGLKTYFSLTHSVRPKLVCSRCTAGNYKSYLPHYAFTMTGQLAISQRASSNLSSPVPLYHGELLLSFFFLSAALGTPEICFCRFLQWSFHAIIKLTEHALIRELVKYGKTFCLNCRRLS